MDKPTLDRLTKAWIDDPAFRQELRKNPEAAIKSVGVTMDPEIKKMLEKIQNSKNDYELLEDRVMKCGPTA